MRGKIIISYPGSKSEIIEYIVNNLDYSKECFIDLFGGSGSVILNKKPHKVDIYNDINEDLYALFYSLHFHYDEFMEKIENLFACEKFFYSLRDMDTSKMSIVEKGVRAFYLYSLSFMGFSYTFAYGYNENLTKKFFSKKQLLKELKEKFKHITVLNKDYREILELIKNKTNIMLYADPPYFGAEYMYRGINFTKEDHETLAKYLNDAKY
ncbi:MAG: DNA adenine methylase, partial [Nanopusillaceae archaeon]